MRTTAFALVSRAASSREALKHPLIDKLSGYLDLGMHKKAGALASQILKKGPFNGIHFSVALDALLQIQTRLKSSLVEGAYHRLALNEKKKVRFWMLGFYHSLGDSKNALPYAARNPRNPPDLMMSLEVFMAMGREESSEFLARKGFRMLSKIKDPFYQNSIRSGLTDYLFKKGKCREVFNLWADAPTESTFCRNKFESVAFSLVAMALHAIRSAFMQLDDLEKSNDHSLEISQPGLEKCLIKQSRNALEKIERSIEKVIPRKEWKNFGLA